ncbi:MAG: hypothetical protein DKINENOH_03503 [bacterium]|nr:hypothetical protein [bacterium]MCK6557675.1 BrnA antitoxin family protein [bacterium]NUM64974.1 hypothetical protein [candidate division KSB1 bacterium]
MPKRKSLPNFGSSKAAGEWLDTHSTADLYAKPVKFSVSRNLQVLVVDAQGYPIESVSLKKRMSQQIRQIAAQEGVSPEWLVQNWLREKIRERLHIPR